jgi:hypothetical protein
MKLILGINLSGINQQKIHTMKDILVKLKNGTQFISPEANLENVARIFESQLLSITEIDADGAPKALKQAEPIEEAQVIEEKPKATRTRTSKK